MPGVGTEWADFKEKGRNDEDVSQIPQGFDSGTGSLCPRTRGDLCSAPPLADCMICQGCFDGLACCTGTDAGFADCFQQTFGCGTYGGPCFQGGGAPDGTLDLSQVAVSQGSYPISPIGGVSDSDEKGITIRRSCDGAILHRRYKEEVQRSQAALTAYIKI